MSDQYATLDALAEKMKTGILTPQTPAEIAQDVACKAAIASAIIPAAELYRLLAELDGARAELVAVKRLVSQSIQQIDDYRLRVQRLVER